MIRSFMSFVFVCWLSCVPAWGQEWARKMFETTDHDFGAVARGAKTEFHFKFSNIYKEDLHIVGVRSSCGCTTPTVTKDYLKTYDEAAIVAQFNTHLFQGHKSATLTVTIDKPFYAEVQLHVQGTIRTDIVVSPGSVELGSVDSGQGTEKHVSVSYAGRPDWQILSVKSSSPHVTAKVAEPVRRGGQVSYDVAVSLKGDAPTGLVKEQIVLLTNDPRSPEVSIDVEGRVVAELSVSPASLFLGALEPGRKVTKQLVVQGRRPFRIMTVAADEGEFDFKPSDAAKAVHLVPVIFTASDRPGKFTYKITIVTDMGEGVAHELSAHVQVIAPAANTVSAK